MNGSVRIVISNSNEITLEGLGPSVQAAIARMLRQMANTLEVNPPKTQIYEGRVPYVTSLSFGVLEDHTTTES